MKFLTVILCSMLAWFETEGLQCWTCINALDENECLTEGGLKKCQWNENACHNEVRRGDKGILITKRCKQDWACTNNEVQNPRDAWNPTQCNSKVPSSVCRCCCTTDGCNKYGLQCVEANSEPTCSPMNTPTFGRKSCRFLISETEIGSVCSFRCNIGYDRIGADSSSCVLKVGESVARFTRPVPKCVPKTLTCSHQRTPAHGNVNCTDGVNIGSVCTYTCEQFHALEGSDKITCNLPGFWDSLPPACVEVSCPSLSPPMNGFVSCSYETKEDSECKFSCQEGYKVVGSLSIVCLHANAEGLWSDEAPFCEKIRCTDIAPLENGNYTCSDGEFLQSECTFACNDDYWRIGTLSSKCVLNEEGVEDWDEEFPFCERIRCSEIAPIAYGFFVCSDDEFLHSECEFFCDVDYRRIGTLSTRCGLDENGMENWDNETPTCQRIKCSEFAPLDNGYFRCSDGSSLHSECEFFCDADYRRIGALSTTCVLDDMGVDMWDEETPVCERIRCLEIAEINDGDYNCSDKTFLHSECEFKCRGFYRIAGPFSTRCILNQHGVEGWDNESPVCEATTARNIASQANVNQEEAPICTPQRPPAHGNVTCTDGVMIGSICTYTCELFHVLEGSETTVCNLPGLWTEASAACVAVTCPALSPLVDGSFSCSRETSEDSECTFSCIEGYRVAGALSTVCLHFGTQGIWSDEVPTCQRIQCSDIVSLDNGFYGCSDGSFLHSECEFFCDADYRRVGALSTRCVLDNNGVEMWDEEYPVCEKILCEDQSLLRHGEVSCTDENSVGSVCSFQCTTEEHALNPPDITTNWCLNDSSWSLPAPCCARVCPPYSAIDLVIAIDSSSSIGKESWQTIKDFVKSLISVFVIAEDAARVGVFRYNKYIDRRNQILLNDYPNDKEGLLQAFDRIPYNGRGTFTGRALGHARRVLLNPSNGNRPDVSDYIVVITDGQSRDQVKRVATRLHSEGVHVIAVGVVPPKGQLDYEQLRDIVNHEEDLVIAERGFDDLSLDIFQDLVHSLCVPGC